MMFTYVAAVLCATVVLWYLLTFNALVKARNAVDQAWSHIEVELKRRFDLIQNLVEVAKGYARHEKETLERVVLARNQAVSATSTAAKSTAENALTQSLRGLFALAEAYPDLKASENFSQLQDDLTDTEDKISAARRYYNATVMRFNTVVQSIPWVLFARPLGFREREFFSAEGDTAVPQVSFGTASGT